MRIDFPYSNPTIYVKTQKNLPESRMALNAHDGIEMCKLMKVEVKIFRITHIKKKEPTSKG